MDARSIAATAANKGVLTSATEFDGEIGKYQYHYDSKIYENRVFDSHGAADPKVEIQLGPNIKDWPAMGELPFAAVAAMDLASISATEEICPFCSLLPSRLGKFLVE